MTWSTERRLSLEQARRISLSAQGFGGAGRPARVTASHLLRLVRRLGLVQIDYVNVLLPAHYQVLFSRLGPYDRSRLNDLIFKRRELMEHWAHEASILPVETWPLLRHRMQTHRLRPWGFEKFMQQNAAYVRRVRRAVRTRGPVAAADLPDPENSVIRRIQDRWGWGLAVKRQVLEADFGRGKLAVAGRRVNLTREYDLAERIVPAEHLRRRVSRKEAELELLRRAACAHGIGSAGDLADYYRMSIKEARPRLAELVKKGELTEVQVESWVEPAYMQPDTRVPRQVNAAALLSPFDPVVWYRERVARLFDFDYRIEIFVPQPKRRWGYYVLPFLLGERLVARVDLKADRKARCLQVPAAYIENHARSSDVAPALAAQLWTLARWLDLETIRIGRRGNFVKPLAATVRAAR